jgi:uncharacterized protein YjbI with pentapeptide repeats
MDCDEALEQLRGEQDGVASWNRLRYSTEQLPDLSRADLACANLAGANLSQVCLRDSKLQDADLRGTKFLWAKWCGPQPSPA